MSGIMCAAGTGWAPLSVTITPSPVAQLAGTATITTPTATATVTGGSGFYTWLWFRIDGDFFTINTPNDQTTSFTATSVGPGSGRDGNYGVLVTDTITGLTVTGQAEVNVERI